MSALPFLFGAVAGLDRTAFGQTLFAHPVVAGGLLAFALGAPPAAILLLGVLLCLDAPQVPVGGAPLPDMTSGALVGVALISAADSAAGYGLALVCALGCGVIGGWSITGQRSLAARGMTRMDRAIEEASLVRLERLHLGLTALSALRGAVVVGIGVLAGRWVLVEVLPHWADTWLTDWLVGIWRLAPWAALPVLCRLHWRGQRPGSVGLALLGGAAILFAQVAFGSSW